jgi:hypothetical protein
MDYRLYLMRCGRIRDAVDIHAADDAAALRTAEQKAAGFMAELWCQSRRVATLLSASAA